VALYTNHTVYRPLAKQQLGTHDCGFAERSCCKSKQKQNNKTTAHNLKHLQTRELKDSGTQKLTRK
jgi:hypothetical protein